MISVALCTYNGERFLGQQLASIKNQSSPVHELVICDDGSTDQTFEIIEAFQKSVNFPVILHKNLTNLGSSKNFEKCIQACSGDIIFLCDQDDLWKKDKIEKQVAFLDAHPDQDAVFSNALMIDQAGASKEKTSFEQIEFTADLQNFWKRGGAFEILSKGYIVTGATLAIRKKICDSVFPVPSIIPELIHDGWIALYLSMDQKIGFLSEVLVEYREHDNQQVGLKGNGPVITLADRFSRARTEKLVRLEKKYNDSLALHSYFVSLPHIKTGIIIKLKQRMEHYRMRSQLPKNRIKRIFPILQSLSRGYYRMHDGGKWWRPLLGDLLE
jgi:glycosyltransferase involved in cell wall biosynthesis